MQYFSLALSLAWPQIMVALIWLGVGLAALWYTRATQRPVFLFVGIAALMISLSEVLSPLRLAYRYFTHRESCASSDACTIELQFGAAKFEWLLVALAAFVLFAGLYLEVSRARRRAAANNAARPAANHGTMGAPPSGRSVPAGAYAGYDVGMPDDYDAAPPESMAGPASPYHLPAPSEDERPTLYRRPPTGSSSGPF